MSTNLAMSVGFILGASLLNFFWLFWFRRAFKELRQVFTGAPVPKSPRFFTLGKVEKRKPKVHDDLKEWSVENDRKIDN